MEEDISKITFNSFMVSNVYLDKPDLLLNITNVLLFIICQFSCYLKASTALLLLSFLLGTDIFALVIFFLGFFSNFQFFQYQGLVSYGNCTIIDLENNSTDAPKCIQKICFIVIGCLDQ